ncbi:hypothetical protein F2Q70_00010840 [Brassica cretica]|uniref:Uncharacterized protein n=1 Tax=Brassica cretica TaxID=69181 RepID=A0A8S9MAC1_BRACR|nr:hypothetical protein F2Q70_00010840 [Brassica cretica]
METTNCPCHKLYHMCLQVLYRRFEPNGESRGTVNLLYTAATQHYQSLVRKPGPPENPISVICTLSLLYDGKHYRSLIEITKDGEEKDLMWWDYENVPVPPQHHSDRYVRRPKGKGIITKHNQVADRRMQALIRKSIKEAQKVVLLTGSRFTWCSLIFGIPQLLNARELVWLNLDAQVATPGQSHV